ncbi:hypothetical protein EVAR_40398_1 [Eumeta japonica]|uniref:Uncharacterized protein n=1 Tax=Eumeta variegata TaxID=151549 RepID=A0A4C1WCT7_EUMVA|nr:hypothetical protein EVAR_40398_1 [Eumeta japonica]
MYGEIVWPSGKDELKQPAEQIYRPKCVMEMTARVALENRIQTKLQAARMCRRSPAISDKNKGSITCTTCLSEKQTRLPFNNIGSRSSQPLQLVHTDLCGPMEQESLRENVEKYNNNIYLPCTSNSNSPEIQPLEETCKEELEDSIDHFTDESREDYQSGENDDSSYIPEQSIDLE